MYPGGLLKGGGNPTKRWAHKAGDQMTNVKGRRKCIAMSNTGRKAKSIQKEPRLTIQRLAKTAIKKKNTIRFKKRHGAIGDGVIPLGGGVAKG